MQYFFPVRIENIYFCLFEKILKHNYNILKKKNIFIAISFYRFIEISFYRFIEISFYHNIACKNIVCDMDLSCCPVQEFDNCGICKSTLGKFIHTRHFCTRDCNKKICDTKIILSHRFQ